MSIKFADLPLTPAILQSLERMTYVTPTDVQSRTIPLVLEGRDVLVTAQTGTGKTAAFAVPALQKMIAALEADLPVPRTLILAPTRELAEQIGTVLRELTFFFRRLRYTVIIGGAPYPKQFRELGFSPAFVVGTPGRLIDHMETGTLKLDDFDTLVLDEADRMLDMGFSPQIDMIVSKFPGVRQTMMFSATLPNEVRALVSRYLKNPARVAIGEENRPVAAIQQDVVQCNENEKDEVLIREIDKIAGSIIVFTRTRLRADLVADTLKEAGHEVSPLHGDLTQRERRSTTQAFRDGKIRILVATDIAARGLDIEHVRHVFNYDLPMVPEDYVHRIGRTGRAGAEGHAVALVTPQDKHRWNQILKLMSGGSAGNRGYKHASANSAFSGSSRDRAQDRRNPFTAAYSGPSEKEIREAGPRKPAPKISYLSAQGKKVREEFQSRVEHAEKHKAKRMGRDPRFTSESNARLRGDAAGGARGAGGGVGGKKPHKGAPDQRKHKTPPRDAGVGPGAERAAGAASRGGGRSGGARADFGGDFEPRGAGRSAGAGRGSFGASRGGARGAGGGVSETRGAFGAGRSGMTVGVRTSSAARTAARAGAGGSRGGAPSRGEGRSAGAASGGRGGSRGAGAPSRGGGRSAGGGRGGSSSRGGGGGRRGGR